MPVSKFDLEYNEYLSRREAAGYGRRPSSVGSRTGRFIPKEAEPPLRTPKKVNPDLLKGDGSYDLPNTIYRPSGYAERPTELGEDPLTTVRTMRNNLRRRALRFEQEDKPVKAHLCETANRELSKAEGQLEHLSGLRKNAILIGDNASAERIRQEMEGVKEIAIRNAYSDLIMENEEMRAFGVDSKWTPDRNRPPTPKYVRPLTPEDARFKPRTVSAVRTRPDSSETRRARTPIRATTPKRAETPKKRPPSATPSIKRNDRLGEIKSSPTNPQPGYDNPYQLPDHSGVCQFCEMGDTNLGTKQGKEDHYARDCLMMNRCRYCSKIVPVPTLTDHYVKRCTFLKDTMGLCPKCGLAQDKLDAKGRIEHPLCRGRKAPEGAEWCPLCSVAVNQDKTSWQNHLMVSCVNNFRRTGIDENPEGLEEELFPSSKPRTNGVSKGTSSYNPNGSRMIDSQKLVKALQDIQAQKKTKKKQEEAPKEVVETKTTTKTTEEVVDKK